jgi:hypothetical protein
VVLCACAAVGRGFAVCCCVWHVNASPPLHDRGGRRRRRRREQWRPAALAPAPAPAQREAEAAVGVWAQSPGPHPPSLGPALRRAPEWVHPHRWRRAPDGTWTGAARACDCHYNTPYHHTMHTHISFTTEQTQQPLHTHTARSSNINKNTEGSDVLAVVWVVVGLVFALDALTPVGTGHTGLKALAVLLLTLTLLAVAALSVLMRCGRRSRCGRCLRGVRRRLTAGGGSARRRFGGGGGGGSHHRRSHSGRCRFGHRSTTLLFACAALHHPLRRATGTVCVLCAGGGGSGGGRRRSAIDHTLCAKERHRITFERELHCTLTRRVVGMLWCVGATDAIAAHTKRLTRKTLAVQLQTL